jgi:hypothetical protein
MMPKKVFFIDSPVIDVIIPSVFQGFEILGHRQKFEQFFEIKPKILQIPLKVNFLFMETLSPEIV